MSVPQLSVHLSFDGNCAEAFAFYASVLGGTPSIMTYGASPMAEQVGPGDKKRAIHANLPLGTQNIMGADATSGHPYTGSTGFAVSLSYRTLDEAKRVFDTLGAGGAVVMPFAPTFWSPGFGMITDRFGIAWMVGCDGPAA